MHYLRFFASGAVFTALSACSSPHTTSPMHVTQRADIQAHASAHIAGTASPSGGAALVTSVTLTNTTPMPVKLTVMLQYPVVIRLYEIRTGTLDTLVFDEAAAPRPLLPQLIRISGGANSVLERVVPLDILRSAGIRSGRYRVEAIVTANPPPNSIGAFTVAAGEVKLP